MAIYSGLYSAIRNILSDVESARVHGTIRDKKRGTEKSIGNKEARREGKFIDAGRSIDSS